MQLRLGHPVPRKPTFLPGAQDSGQVIRRSAPGKGIAWIIGEGGLGFFRMAEHTFAAAMPPARPAVAAAAAGTLTHFRFIWSSSSLPLTLSRP